MSDTNTRRLASGASLVGRMAAAYRDGRDTAAAGEPRVNPWRGLADDPRERVLAQMWGRGYATGNPMPWPDEDDTAEDDTAVQLGAVEPDAGRLGLQV